MSEDLSCSVREAESALHAKLLAARGDEGYAVFARYLGPLLHRLQTRFGRSMIARELEDLAYETVKRYLLAPHNYRPGGRPVSEYLWMDAKGDALNLLRRRQPLVQSELAFGADWPAEDASEDAVWDQALGAVPGLPDGVTIDEVLRRVRTALPAPQDQEFLRVWLTGERHYTHFVAVLGLEGKSPAEQQEAVSKARDRILKALRRLGRGLSDA